MALCSACGAGPATQALECEGCGHAVGICSSGLCALQFYSDCERCGGSFRQPAPIAGTRSLSYGESLVRASVLPAASMSPSAEPITCKLSFRPRSPSLPRQDPSTPPILPASASSSTAPTSALGAPSLPASAAATTGEFITKLFVLQPAEQAPADGFELPPALVWDGNAYVEGPHELTMEQRPAPDIVAELQDWRQTSLENGLADSLNIIQNLIGLLTPDDDDDDDEEADPSSIQFIVMRCNGELVGVSCFELDGTLEHAEPIPEQDGRWFYRMYSAANPASQLPQATRPVGTVGAVGTVLQNYYRYLSNRYRLPVYSHQTTQRSADLARRSGMDVVYP